MLNRLSPTILHHTEDEQKFDLQEILHFAWRHWKFIVSVVCAALLVGVVGILQQTPRYTASALILLEPQYAKSPQALANDQSSNLDDALVESQMAIIRSSVFLRRVVEKAGLVSDPEFGSGSAPTGTPQDGSSQATA